jgi:hypothetical protein
MLSAEPFLCRAMFDHGNPRKKQCGSAFCIEIIELSAKSAASVVRPTAHILLRIQSPISRATAALLSGDQILIEIVPANLRYSSI